MSGSDATVRASFQSTIVVLCVGCSVAPPHGESTGTSSLDPALSRVVDDVPALAAVVGEARPLHAAEDGWRLSTGSSSAKDSRPPAVSVLLPRRSDGDIVVTSGEPRRRAVLRRLGATPWEAKPGAASVHYPRIAPDVDAVWFATAGVIEELLHVRGAVDAISYELELPEGADAVQRTPRAVDFMMGSERWMTVRVPGAWDAAGRAVDAGIAIRGDVLEIRWPSTARRPLWIDPSWESAGVTAHALSEHTSTQLLDGRVLIVGASEGLTFAELYSPFEPDAGDRFTTLPSPNGPRRGATATLLPSGAVLLAGGMAGDTATATAELFDPTTLTFHELDVPMGTARALHTATLLPSGNVLLAGGESDGPHHEATPTLELYLPGSGIEPGAFVPAGVMSEPRMAHTATLLTDGRALFAGGFSGPNGGPTASTDVYGEASGTAIPGPALLILRARHTATLLHDGRVLITGGGQFTGGEIGTTELYEPADGGPGSIGPGPDMSGPRATHTATLMPSGDVLIVGGGDQAEVFQPPGSFAPTAGMPWMLLPRSGHTASMLPTSNVAVIGGNSTESGGLPSRNAHLFDPYGAGGVPGEATVVTAGYKSYAGHSVTLLPDGRVLIAGGSSAIESPLDRAILFDPNTLSYVDVGPMHDARFGHRATLLPSGRVLITGGCGADCYATINEPGSLASAELFDPGKGFVAVSPMHQRRGMHTSTLLRDGRVLIAGGVADALEATKTAEVFDPSSEAFSTLPDMAELRAAHSATSLPNGRVLLAGGTGGNDSASLFEPSTNTFTSAGNMNSPRQLHGATLLADGRVLLTGGYSTALATSIRSAEVYSPGSNGSPGSFQAIGDMYYPRAAHVAQLLPDGRVWVGGGIGAGESQFELYDPSAKDGVGAFVSAGALGIARNFPAATLIGDGRVLVVDGVYPDGSGNTSIHGFPASQAPVPPPRINSAPPTYFAGVPGAVQGKGLWTVWSGSSGSTQDSPSNVPIGAWVRLDGGGRVSVSLRDFEPLAANAVFPSAALAGVGVLFPIVGGVVGPGVITNLVASPIGAPCSGALDCAGGFCVDGVCCDSACDSTCATCSAQHKGGGDDGNCGSVAQGLDPRDDCATLGTSTCSSNGWCDGAGACEDYTGGTSCGGGHLCPGGGDPCPTACAGDTECEEGFVCDATTHDCMPVSSRCDGDHTVQTPTGAENCSPYRCSPSDMCLAFCKSTSDCVLGWVCNARDRCVRETPVQGLADEGSCGCAAVGRTRASVSVLGALAVLVWLAERKRRGTPAVR